jgi:hypothetical protein
MQGRRPSPRLPERSAVASSPNSSVSQRKVAASPRAASFWPYICKIIRCTAESVKVPDEPDFSIINSSYLVNSGAREGNNFGMIGTSTELKFGFSKRYHQTTNDAGVVANPRSSP